MAIAAPPVADPPPSPRPAARRVSWLPGAVLIVLVTFAAYANSLQGPFVFDDLPSIVDNPSIRQPGTALAPPGGGITVSARPLLNLSFALNYRLSSTRVWSYHGLNVLIHTLAALTLFGLLRQTLRVPVLAGRFGPDAGWLSPLIALLWAVHPLQTESVTYVVQRAESLASLFYLLTLYCFARGAVSATPRRWFGAAVAAGLLGAVTKEIIVTAPLLVLIYDRTFVSGGFRAAGRKHAWVYTGLAASWLVVGALLLLNGNRGGTAGFDVPLAWWEYALKQAEAVVIYLKLACWPHPLVLDYTADLPVTAGRLALSLAVLLPLLGLALWALVRRPAVGFLGAAFFLILAPSSSIVPVATQVMAEHRMYLALAAPLTLLVLAGHRWLGRRTLWLGAGLAIAGGVLTAARNHDYRSPITLWTQALARAENPRAHLNLGIELADAGRPLEALSHYEAAARINPRNARARYNEGNVLLSLGRRDEAVAAYADAISLDPRLPEAYYNLGNALVQQHRLAAAVTAYSAALRLRPDHAATHYNLANTLVELGRLDEAIGEFQAALRLAPDHADARFNLGNALLQSGRPAAAAAEYEAVLRLHPGDADAARNLAAAREAAVNRR